MRAGELVGRAVVEHDGRPLGVCTDVRCWREPTGAGAAPGLRLAGLVVSPRHAGSLLGYERGRLQGPHLLARLVRRLHRGAVVVPWEDVESVPDDVHRPVVLAATRRAIPL